MRCRTCWRMMWRRSCWRANVRGWRSARRRPICDARARR
jgi:hypothetical protein